MNVKTDLVSLDTTGLKCPLLFVKTKQSLKRLLPNQQLEVLVADQSGVRDIRKYLDKNSYRYTMTSAKVETVKFCIWGLSQDV